jgi:hypothetical protein
MSGNMNFLVGCFYEGREGELMIGPLIYLLFCSFLHLIRILENPVCFSTSISIVLFAIADFFQQR